MDQTGRGSLASALNARSGSKPEIIARVKEAWGSYHEGDFVFVNPYGDGTCTIEVPMTPSQIASEKLRGSGLRTWLACVAFPLSRVEIVLE